MGFGNLSEEYRVTKRQDTFVVMPPLQGEVRRGWGSLPSQRGVALFTAMMLLVLVSGLSLFVLQNATTEMKITHASKTEFVHISLAESGIEQALAWYNNPSGSPDPTFFDNKVCGGEIDNPEKEFSYFIKEIGESIRFRFYRSSQQKIGCTVEATAGSGKRVTVELAGNPMPPITAGMFTQPVDVDLERVSRMNAIKRFAKRFGRYFIVSPNGTLEEQGVEQGSFDTVFANTNVTEVRLPVFIDRVKNHSSLDPVKIGKGPYRGYFYFSGDITVQGDGIGRSVLLNANQKLDHIDLDGFFYTSGRIILDNEFAVYGALFSGLGFEGDGVPKLEMWYNTSYSFGSYKDVLPLIPRIGTRKFM